MHIIAYTYEADYHCITCTVKRYKNSICIDYLRGKPCRDCRDSNGVLYEQKDRDGNFVHPVHAIDEWGEFGVPTNRTRYGVLIMNQAIFCGDCHDVIAEYTVPVTGTDAWQGSLAIYRSNNQIN